MRNNLTDVEKYAYTAGVLDGEGYIRIFRDTRNKERTFYHARLTITNTNRDLVEWLAENHGGFISTRVSKEGYKNTYDWSIIGDDKVGLFITRVYPYLIVKKKQAQEILNFVNKDILDNGESIYERMSELNKKAGHGPNKNVGESEIGSP